MTDRITKPIFLSFLCLFTFSTANAATGPKQLETGIPGEKPSSTFFLTAGPGLAFYGDNIGWALNIGALSQVGDNRSLFWGADAGINAWRFETATNPRISSTATGIQLLPTILYRFEVGSEMIHPYVGVSMGPHLYIERQTVGNVIAENDRVFFELLFRPGLFTHLGKSFSIQLEAKLGILQSRFIFLPQGNAVFAL